MYIYTERHTWQPDKVTPPRPSFRRFSTTAVLSGTAGRERWRIGRGSCQRFAGEELARRRCRPRPHRALTAYKDFLALWKDADPDIPILKEAKAEYAKLHSCKRI